MKAADDAQLGLIGRLVDRLERLSADSTFAHKASGLRGSLLRYMHSLEAGEEVNDIELENLVGNGYEILESAAKEIGDST